MSPKAQMLEVGIGVALLGLYVGFAAAGWAIRRIRGT